jgi:hypothetical protein
MSSGKRYGKKPFQGKSKNYSSKQGETATNNEKKKHHVTDFTYHLGSAKQASDYETATEFFINYIKKTYDYGNDIGSSMEQLEPIDTSSWKPKMQLSSKDDKTEASEKALEERQFEIEFKADYDEYRKRLQVLENNQTKAYALLWERCAKSMKNKIESRADFDKIKNDPINLLKAIKEHALNYQENRYSMSIILDAMRTLMSTKQKDKEILQDYTKRFRVARDVMKSHLGGPIILTKLVEAIQDYDIASNEEQKNFQDKTFNQFLAFLYLENSDKTKYGSLLVGLNTQQSLGNDQYPRTITEATNVLSNHKHDIVHTQANPKKPDGNKSKKDKEDEDKGEDEINLSFAQMEGKCYCCGKPGHKSPTCRLKDKPKDQWAINKASGQSHAQSVQPDGASVSGSVTPSSSASVAPPPSTSSSVTGWAGVHLQFQQVYGSQMRYWILLDNQSSISVFCNRDMVQNIRKSEFVMELATNGGVLKIRQRADLPGWGEVWFHEKAITNILSYAEMVDKHRITYDSANEDAFVVHLSKDKTVRFTRFDNNLYVFKPSIGARVEHQLLNSVEENKSFYTERQFERAKMARDLYHAMGTPSLSDFKKKIKNLNFYTTFLRLC